MRNVLIREQREAIEKSIAYSPMASMAEKMYDAMGSMVVTANEFAQALQTMNEMINRACVIPASYLICSRKAAKSLRKLGMTL